MKNHTGVSLTRAQFFSSLSSLIFFAAVIFFVVSPTLLMKIEGNTVCDYTVTQLQNVNWRYINCTATDCSATTFICNPGENCIIDCSGPNIGTGKCRDTTLDCYNANNCIFKCNDGSNDNQCRHAELRCTNIVGGGFCMIDCQQSSSLSASNLCLHFHQYCNQADPCYFQCINANCGKVIFRPSSCHQVN